MEGNKSEDLGTLHGHPWSEKRLWHFPFARQREIGETLEPQPFRYVDIRFQPVLQLRKVLDSGAPIPEPRPFRNRSSRCFMIPAGGGLRILTIIELLVKDYLLDLFRQEMNLSKVGGCAEACE